jgi:phosphinothricin acetyltransferase
VLIENDEVLGWAALSKVSQREVYAGVAEVSVYVASRAQGKGVGSELMKALIELSEQNGIWTLQASIIAENVSSLSLHQRHGFRRVGHRERIAKRDGAWRDTILLERRSTLAGVD